MNSFKTKFSHLFFPFLILFFSMPSFAYPNLLPFFKSFICTGILSGLKFKNPTPEEQAKNLNFTAKQLRTFMDFTLGTTFATPRTQSFLLESSIDNLRTHPQNYHKLANQVEGLIKDTENGNSPIGKAMMSLSVNGRVNIDNFMAGLVQKNSNYDETIKNHLKDNPKLKKESDQANSRLKLEGMGLNAAFILLTEAIKHIYFPGSNPWVASSTFATVSFYKIESFFAFGILGHLLENKGKIDRGFDDFLGRVYGFIQNPPPNQKVIYFSKNYKIFPSTFSSTLKEGEPSLDALLNENESILNAPIKTLQAYYHRQKAQNVQIDFFLENSTSPTHEPTLHVYFRSDEKK